MNRASAAPALGAADKLIAAKPFTRAQLQTLASCWWGHCHNCGERVPLIKAVGTPWKWHKCPGPRPHRLQRGRQLGSRLVSPNGLDVMCITRGTKWGNPYSGCKRALTLAERSVVVEEFEKALWLGILDVDVADVRRELRGKNLACWCAIAQVCHGDVLLRIAAEDR